MLCMFREVQFFLVYIDLCKDITISRTTALISNLIESIIEVFSKKSRSVYIRIINR